jgi:hypothetical protein
VAAVVGLCAASRLSGPRPASQRVGDGGGGTVSGSGSADQGLATDDGHAALAQGLHEAQR